MRSVNTVDHAARTRPAPGVIGVAARAFERLDPRALRLARDSSISDLDWALKSRASSLMASDYRWRGGGIDDAATNRGRVKGATGSLTMPTAARDIGAWRGQLTIATRALIKVNDEALAAADGPALRRLEAVVDRWSKLVQFERERRSR